MALPWKTEGPKTVHIALGFFYVVNFCLGVGFLGIPYSFYYSGYVAAIPTLLVIMLVSWINANYVVECMARAQALETHRISETVNKYSESQLLKDYSDIHPKFEISHRKFEQVEMCEIFYGKWVKYLYLIIVTIYSFLALWPASTVAGSAWASNLPFNYTIGNDTIIKTCREFDFQQTLLPPEPCLNSYYISLTIFGFIVILLSLLDLKEQAIVQMTLGLLRFITIAAIVIYCIVNIAEFKSKCLVDGIPSVNETHFITNSTHYPPLKLFDFFGWITSIPVFTYAIILHSGIPSLTHPVRQKQYIHWLVAAMFLTVGLCYLVLGVVVSLWFSADIQETCTLNWGELTTPPASLPLRILSYYIILFPSLDVVSAYPLGVHVIVNNIYVIITGQDTSEKPKHPFAKYDLLLRLALRLFGATVPILTAFGIANLITVLNYAGLFGFTICFGFPTALQLRSIYVCKKRFAHTLNKSPVPPIKGLHSVQETTPLIPATRGRDTQSLYMTPYSNRLFSHPLAAGLIGAIGFVLFCLTFASLFLHPEAEVCDSGLDTLFDKYEF